jgi:hypothetical protein
MNRANVKLGFTDPNLVEFMDGIIIIPSLSK